MTVEGTLKYPVATTNQHAYPSELEMPVPSPRLYFAVSDLETYLERVRAQAGAVVRREIDTQPWGERSFYCSDPFGNKLCFVDDRTLFTADVL